VLFIFTLISLCRESLLNPFLIALFSLNEAITGWFGLRGGQVHEMLGYALGVAHLTLLLEKKCLASALCLGASIVIHPIIALPFCMVFATFVLRGFFMVHSGSVVLVIILVFALV